jgi:L,D-transpeptidase ErfK/SrfK
VSDWRAARGYDAEEPREAIMIRSDRSVRRLGGSVRRLGGLCAVALGVSLAVPASADPGPADIAASGLVGAVNTYTTHYDDTLLDVARASGLGYTEMVVANPGVDPWLPGEGTEVVLPTGHLLPDGAREGILINLGDHRLYFFPGKGQPVLSYPIGVGREGWATPIGRTTIVRKQKDPTWYPPPSVQAEKPELPKVVPPGPDNPLGRHAMYLGFENYLLHGTNRPWGVGRRVSHGCIRLYPEDIADLFERVAIGTPVEIVDQTVKLAWLDGELFMEAHPETTQIAQIEESGSYDRTPVDEIGEAYADMLRSQAGDAIDRLDWDAIKKELGARSGIPTRITLP